MYHICHLLFLLSVAVAPRVRTEEQWRQHREDAEGLAAALLDSFHDDGTAFPYSEYSGDGSGHEEEGTTVTSGPETTTDDPSESAEQTTVEVATEGQTATAPPVTTLTPDQEATPTTESVGGESTEAGLEGNTVDDRITTRVPESFTTMQEGDNHEFLPSAIGATWKYLRAAALEALEAQGDDVVRATKRVLQSSSVRLGTRYSASEPFLSAVTKFLTRTAGFSSTPDDSEEADLSARILWNQAFSDLQSQALHLTEKAQVEGLERLNEVNQSRIIKSVLITVSFLLTLSVWIIATSCYKWIGVWKTERKLSKERKEAKRDARYQAFTRLQRQEDSATAMLLQEAAVKAERVRVQGHPALGMNSQID